jgi:hypothetical protein
LSERKVDHRTNANMAHYAKLTPEKKKEFCDILLHGWSVLRAAELLQISRETAYDHRGKDPDFKSNWEQAKVEAMLRHEDELNKRAFQGVDTPIVHNGKIMMEEVDGVMVPVTVKKKSDILLMFAMKAENPVKYKEKSAVEHKGVEGLAKKMKNFQDASKRADKACLKRN